MKKIELVNINQQIKEVSLYFNDSNKETDLVRFFHNFSFSIHTMLSTHYIRQTNFIDILRKTEDKRFAKEGERIFRLVDFKLDHDKIIFNVSTLLGLRDFSKRIKFSDDFKIELAIKI